MQGMDKNEATRILRAAGNWAEGMSDQGDGSMRTAVVLDVSRMPRHQIDKVREALQVHAGSSTVKEGMGHPVTGTRKTIGVEAIPGNQGLKDLVALTDGPLRGHLFHFDDGPRDWVRSHGHDVTLQQAGGARKEHTIAAKPSRIGLLWAGVGAITLAAGALIFGARGEKESVSVQPSETQRPTPVFTPELMHRDPVKPFNQLSSTREGPKPEAGIAPPNPKLPPRPTM